MQQDFVINRQSSIVRYLSSAPLHLSRILYKSTLFMQNKPNFRKSQMNVSNIITRNYENVIPLAGQKNKPNFRNAQNERKLICYRGL